MTSEMTSRIQGLTNRAKVAVKLRRLKLRRKTFPLTSALRKMGLAPKSAFGVNLVAYIRAEMGLGQAARGMATALDAAGIPFAIVNYEQGSLSAHTNADWSDKEVDNSDFHITLLCVNPDNLMDLRASIPNSLLSKRYVIANWFWELPEIPDDWVKEFSNINEVWAASEFIREAVSRRTSLPVFRIPPVVEAKPQTNLPRSFFGLPDDRFLFLCVIDSLSVVERKNPIGAIRAFKCAFGPRDRAALALKFNKLDYFAEELARVRDEIGEYENIYIIDRVFSRDEMNCLLQQSDAVVSLHHSEGFGLVPAESMSLGKPVILTNWSGNTDYMTRENSIGIGYDLVRLGKDFGPYKANQLWAEPDLEEAAYWMKRLVDEPEIGQKIGHHARAFIETHFSPGVVGNLIRERVEFIHAHS